MFAAGVTATGISLVRSASGLAQEGAGTATPASGVAAEPRGDVILNDAMITGQVQFIHPEKVFFYLPGLQDEAAIAGMYGLDVDQYRAIRSHFEAITRQAAEDLLADDELAARVDRLPFRAQATLVGIGDSFTDDLQSWLEILRQVLALRRPEDQIQVVNAAVSARTSVEILHYIMPTLGLRPDWIFCLVGGNDAKRTGPEPAKTLVSVTETAANLDAVRRLAAAQTEAEWVWITPGTVDETRIAAFPGFQQGQSSWRNTDLLAIGDEMRGRPEPVVDLQALFGNPPDPELLGPDGLHPSLAGQQAIARAVIERLTA
jgi:lysophospholipase L1-like esterase